MMINILSQQIWERPEFQKEYHLLLKNNAELSLHLERWKEKKEASEGSTNEIGDSNLISEDSIQRLLQSATSFAATSQLNFREAAYRIAVSSLALYNTEFENIKDFAMIVFSRLGNFPAVEFMFKGVKENERGLTIPITIWGENQFHLLYNSFQISDGNILSFTDFQCRLWEKLLFKQSAAITAPTSAGKSYVLQNFLVKSLKESVNKWGLYLIPTRALINQVTTSLLNLAKRFGYHPIIANIPVSPIELGAEGGIYVLTQERLQILLENSPELKFETVIIDESQIIGDSARGIILQTVIEEILLRNKDTQILFSSPQTKNPEVFQNIFDIPKIEVFKETESPVAQNFVFLDTESVFRNKVNISVELHNQKEFMGTMTLPVQLIDDEQKLAVLTHLFGTGEKNLIYAGGKAKCEHIAGLISQLIQSSKEIPKDETAKELDVLSKFIKTHVHQQYILGTTIEYGVAFHYGNMPAVVRKTIEDYFTEGKIDYLVCTSTLLHGVNLPAKNLFLFDPTKGSDRITHEELPITPIEFWNLAGRVGRLGKEFEGNVFLIDQERWRTKPFDGERIQKIKAALEDTITIKKEALIAFVKDREHPSGKDLGAENAFIKLVNEAYTGKLEKTLNKYYPDDKLAQEEVRTLIDEAIKEINIPVEIIKRNIYVSVFRQQEMLDYLIKRINDDGPQPFIPMHPASPWKDAIENYIRLFKRIHTHFQKIPSKDKSQVYFAPLALRWMRGDSLPVLIDDAYKYRIKKSPRTSIGTVIVTAAV
jgi:superfamily II DNA/RNA helicase